MSQKIPFRSVVSLVIGSQIGSGVFLLPASLALLGPISLWGWVISGIGAILLALVFGKLSLQVTKGGGPHTYIEKAFGRRAAFYTAWTYWVVSWVSSIAVIIAAVGYLSSLFHISSTPLLLFIEGLIIVVITLLNLRGTTLAGSVELLLTCIKCLPLVIIPIACLFYLDLAHFTPMNPNNLPLVGSLNAAALMTFWGFVGLETPTAASGIIENPTKTIPHAILLGTLIAALIYFLNSFSIMGVIPNSVLSQSQAPYVVATRILFGNGWDLLIALIAFIACIGTLNAWVLTSGQIALEASKDGLFPPIFSKTNRFNAPHMGLLISLFLILGLLIFTLNPNLLEQINFIIDISVISFLLIYLACALALIKISTSKKITFLALGASLFCLAILAFVSPSQLLFSFLFTLSGVPIYFWQKRTSLRKKEITAPF